MERLPGFRDFYPEPLPSRDAGWSADVRHYIFDNWRSVAGRYGFREYDGPPLEPLELYTTKSGDEIVGQLYNFTDKGERAVALRPEMTPTLARMIAAHARNYRKPIKWFAIPQLFRYERQQKGRLREHFQFNADIFGETDPAADAELIALLIDSLRALKLTEADFVIRLSSRNAWHEFFERGMRSAKREMEQEYEFYQIIDKLEREDPAQSDSKLKAIGFSLDAVTQFIAAGKPTAELDVILNNLAARGLAEFVKIDYNVIRGLAYYTGAVFEAFDKKGEFRAIAGGGRYDNLVKLISGGKVDLPGLGFGLGDVVLTELLNARGLLPKFDGPIDIYCLVEDEAMRPASLKLIQDLREAGLKVDYPFVPAKPDKQFKRAVESPAKWTIKLEGPKDGKVQARLKLLRTREERLVPLDQVLSSLRLKAFEPESKGSYNIEDLLQLVRAEGASRLTLRPGKPPVLRIRGVDISVEGPVIGHENARRMLRGLSDDQTLENFDKSGQVSFDYAWTEGRRFQVRVSLDQGTILIDLERID